MDTAKTKYKEYIDDWRANHSRTELPGLVKLAYSIIVCGCLAYFSLNLYSNAGNHQETAVRVLNAATEASAVLMYAIAAMVIIFALVVIASSSGKPHD